MSRQDQDRDDLDDRSPALPRTERYETPLYLARYLERRARAQAREAVGDGAAAEGGDGESVPLYLRTFRARRSGSSPMLAPPPVRSGPGGWTDAWLLNSKSKEVAPPPEVAEPARVEAPVLDVHMVRHGETQGYSVDGGLSPMGGWQGHRRGQELSKGIADGEHVLLVAAPTARAMQTAEHMRRGIEDGLVLWGREARVDGPEPIEEFRNFQVWTPSGVKDPTQAFRQYHAVMERYERVALGDRPLWLVELDRFWRLQLGGGDPIAFWMSVPLLNFEPPAHVVLRLWQGLSRLARETPPGTRVVCATHSGPMRALATWAFGHDPGEPYNTEEVRVKVRRTGKEALVTFRNRTQEVHVPPPSEWPRWPEPSEEDARSSRKE